MKIDIEGLSKVAVLKALYDAAIPTDKTDLSRELTLDDIKEIADTSRIVNVINGKNIKIDIGRNKLSSGVFDRFNGNYAAQKAIDKLKSQYHEIESIENVSGSEQESIDLMSCLKPGTKAVIRYKNHPIYSDNIDEDEIRSRVHPAPKKRKRNNRLGH